MQFLTMDGPVAWAWRSVPRWSMDDSTVGIEQDEETAKQAAERAMDDSRMISAIVMPLGMVLGQWKALGDPSIALRTVNGAIRWHDDPHAHGVAHLAERRARQAPVTRS
jgi:hypothetical protein